MQPVIAFTAASRPGIRNVTVASSESPSIEPDIVPVNSAGQSPPTLIVRVPENWLATCVVTETSAPQEY
jgi:hypothetical protein